MFKAFGVENGSRTRDQRAEWLPPGALPLSYLRMCAARAALGGACIRKNRCTVPLSVWKFHLRRIKQTENDPPLFIPRQRRGSHTARFHFGAMAERRAFTTDHRDELRVVIVTAKADFSGHEAPP